MRAPAQQDMFFQEFLFLFQRSFVFFSMGSVFPNLFVCFFHHGMVFFFFQKDLVFSKKKVFLKGLVLFRPRGLFLFHRGRRFLFFQDKTFFPLGFLGEKSFSNMF